MSQQCYRHCGLICVLSDLCVLYIFFKPLLQVHKKVVRYHGRYTESQLEGLVEEGVYPPSIKCAMLYSSTRDFERPSLETFDMTIAGTTKHHVSFPIKVYPALGESKYLSMTRVHRQKQFDLCWHVACCSLSCNNTPDCIMISFTSVSPPPATLIPSQTEATSQPSLSLWEAARKWANLCGV